MDITRQPGDVDLIFDGDDAVTAAFAMLAFVMGALPPAEREARLEEIEDGRLRAAVTRCVLGRVYTQRQARLPYPVAKPN